MVCDVCYGRFAEVVPPARDIRNAQLSDKVKPLNTKALGPTTGGKADEAPNVKQVRV